MEAQAGLAADAERSPQREPDCQGMCMPTAGAGRTAAAAWRASTEHLLVAEAISWPRLSGGPWALAPAGACSECAPM